MTLKNEKTGTIVDLLLKPRTLYIMRYATLYLASLNEKFRSSGYLEVGFDLIIATKSIPELNNGKTNLLSEIAEYL